ncbi:MAG: HalOD1 output domain-containing protein [Halobacteriaceae archaeon]
MGSSRDGWTDAETGTVVFDAGDAESTSEEILLALRDRFDLPADAPPLCRCIDPDALDDLFVRDREGLPRTEGQLSFRYAGYRIDVRSSGVVRIQRPH